jgi:5'(3')-deoxyribonucleotidase
MGKHEKPEHEKAQFLIFLDFDGVVFDYDKGCVEAGPKFVKSPWLAKNEPGFFEKLEPLGNAIAWIHRLEKEFPNQVRFLTSATYSRPEAWSEKVISYKKWFPRLHKRLIITSDKGACGGSDDILVDDHPEWNGADRFRGTVVHFKGQESWEVLYNLCVAKKNYMESLHQCGECS